MSSRKLVILFMYEYIQLWLCDVTQPKMAVDSLLYKYL